MLLIYHQQLGVQVDSEAQDHKMTDKKRQLAARRRNIAMKEGSDAVKRKLGHSANETVPGIEPSDFVGQEFHDLRWGWFFFLSNKQLPELLLRVSYQYKNKRFSTTMYSRQWIDYKKDPNHG